MVTTTRRYSCTRAWREGTSSVQHVANLSRPSVHRVCACVADICSYRDPSCIYLASRYNASKKYAATRELLLSGTKALLEKRQYNEATELATLYVDALALAEVPDTDAKALGTCSRSTYDRGGSNDHLTTSRFVQPRSTASMPCTRARLLACRRVYRSPGPSSSTSSASSAAFAPQATSSSR